MRYIRIIMHICCSVSGDVVGCNKMYFAILSQSFCCEICRGDRIQNLHVRSATAEVKINSRIYY